MSTTNGTWAWACEQLVAGWKVRRKRWGPGVFIHVGGVVEEPFMEWLTATDWELFDEPAGEPYANPWRSFEEVLPGYGVMMIETAVDAEECKWNRTHRGSGVWVRPNTGFQTSVPGLISDGWVRWRPLPDTDPQPDANGWVGSEVEYFGEPGPIVMRWSDGGFTAMASPEDLPDLVTDGRFCRHVTHWRRLVGPVGVE